MSNPNEEKRMDRSDLPSKALPTPQQQLAFRIESDFAVHHCPPTSPATEKMATLREHLRQAALVAAELVPAGREQSIVFTKLEEAMFWANAGIARKLPILPEDQ